MTIETTQYNYCKCTFTYEKKHKRKKYCSTKCAHAYHNAFVRDKDKMRQDVARFYQENPAKRFYAATKASAKKRGLLFDLIVEWFEQHLKSGVCELTGLPTQFMAIWQQVSCKPTYAIIHFRLLFFLYPYRVHYYGTFR